MGRLGRGLRIGLVAAVAAGGGCAFGKKPYAGDPLLARHRGVWGDRDKARAAAAPADDGPVAPPPPDVPPPNAPLIAGAVTSPE